jgi:hypothetical protein
LKGFLEAKKIKLMKVRSNNMKVKSNNAKGNNNAKVKKNQRQKIVVQR